MASCKKCKANVGCVCNLHDGLCAACKSAEDKAKQTSPKPIVKNVKS